LISSSAGGGFQSGTG
jgi:hypothetical protein